MSNKEQDFYDIQLQVAATLVRATGHLIKCFKAVNEPCNDQAFLKVLKNMLMEADNLFPKLWYSFDELEACDDWRADVLRVIICNLEDNVKAISDFSGTLEAAEREERSQDNPKPAC